MLPAVVAAWPTSWARAHQAVSARERQGQRWPSRLVAAGPTTPGPFRPSYDTLGKTLYPARPPPAVAAGATCSLPCLPPRMRGSFLSIAFREGLF